jgi:hypothetical protein
MLSEVLLTTALTLGGWGQAACGPVGPSDDGYEWRTHPADPGRSYLYHHGEQIAGYDHTNDVYRPYDARNDTWGPPEMPPWKSIVTNYGIDTAQLNDSGAERFRLNGIPASREQAWKALAAAPLPDDAARPRLTVIGDPTTTAPVLDDLAHAPALAAWKDRLLVQRYPPDHWAVAQTGFVTSGHPTIYLQAPDGTVLHRQDDYADGPAGLAKAIRRADPHYDPRKDPDLRQGLFHPHLDLSKLPLPAWLLLAGAGYLLLRRR